MVSGIPNIYSSSYVIVNMEEYESITFHPEVGEINMLVQTVCTRFNFRRPGYKAREGGD